LGQYVLAISVLLLARALTPKSFLGRSIVVILVIQNLIEQPPYIASLWGDSLGALQVLDATGIGLNLSIGLLEGAAAVLFILGGYFCWKILREYLSHVFAWMGSRTSSQTALVLVGFYSAIVWAGSTVLNGTSFLWPSTTGAAIFVAFLLIFSLVIIPPAPRSWDGANAGPSSVTLAIIFLFFVESLLIYYFVLPIMIQV